MCYHPRVDYIDQLIYLTSKVLAPTCSHGSADLPELVSSTCSHGLADLPELQGAITLLYVDYKDQPIYLSLKLAPPT